MLRRDLILGIGGVIARPIAARAQQRAMPVVGFLSALSTGFFESGPTAAFRQALNDVGYTEGRNVAFEFRSADGHYDRLPDLAADLARRPVALIVATFLPAALAAKAATATIPIVFWTGGDAVEERLVASFNHPGGNLTGFSMLNNVLGAKRFELLREIVPNAAVFALLVNSSNPNAEPQIKDAQQAASTKGVQLAVLKASTEREIEDAFARLSNVHADGLLVAADPLFFGHRIRVIALAAQFAVPTIYTVRAYAAAGGLISYTSSSGMDDQLGNYVGRILNGENPADLPVIRPTKFQLVINLKTAQALGLTVPQLLLAMSDEVIE
jgi:putative tryptophan/tyrosine transport system substrate-binding protein